MVGDKHIYNVKLLAGCGRWNLHASLCVSASSCWLWRVSLSVADCIIMPIGVSMRRLEWSSLRVQMLIVNPTTAQAARWMRIHTRSLSQLSARARTHALPLPPTQTTRCIKGSHCGDFTSQIGQRGQRIRDYLNLRRGAKGNPAKCKPIFWEKQRRVCKTSQMGKWMQEPFRCKPAKARRCIWKRLLKGKSSMNLEKNYSLNHSREPCVFFIYHFSFLKPFMFMHPVTVCNKMLHL